jgi:hypothetical protein
MISFINLKKLGKPTNLQKGKVTFDVRRSKRDLIHTFYFSPKKKKNKKTVYKKIYLLSDSSERGNRKSQTIKIIVRWRCREEMHWKLSVSCLLFLYIFISILKKIFFRKEAFFFKLRKKKKKTFSREKKLYICKEGKREEKGKKKGKKKIKKISFFFFSDFFSSYPARLMYVEYIHNHVYEKRKRDA